MEFCHSGKMGTLNKKALLYLNFMTWVFRIPGTTNQQLLSLLLSWLCNRIEISTEISQIFACHHNSIWDFMLIFYSRRNSPRVL